MKKWWLEFVNNYMPDPISFITGLSIGLAIGLVLLVTAGLTI